MVKNRKVSEPVRLVRLCLERKSRTNIYKKKGTSNFFNQKINDNLKYLSMCRICIYKYNKKFAL